MSRARSPGSRGRLLRALELEDGASRREIAEARRLLLQVWHPDRFAEGSSLRGAAEERTKRINEAAQVLLAGVHSSVADAPEAAPEARSEGQPSASLLGNKIFAAVVAENHSRLRELLLGGASPDAIASAAIAEQYPQKVSTGDCALVTAICLESSEAINILLKAGANVNLSSSDGITPLLAAVHHGSDAMAIRLLDLGANADARDKFGLGAIHKARRRPLIEELLRRGVDINGSAWCYGWAPIHYASFHGNSERMEILLELGALLRVEGKRGEGPLHVAAGTIHGASKVIDLLVQAGADLEARDKTGATPLLWALGVGSHVDRMLRGSEEFAIHLVENGANVSVADNEGNCAKEVASKREYKKLLQRMKMRTENDRTGSLLSRMKLWIN